ncbi:MAG: glutamine-hydrolyzing carbamoyl-phosphate synthase small subunit [Bacillota bacterium]
MRGVLCLEDGFFVRGELLNYTAETAGEVVFFTGMTGYEEALTDPSYCGQILVFTFPMIGNYGLPAGSGQSSRMMVRGLVARDIWESPAGYDGVKSLGRGLLDDSRPAIYGLDTRELVLHLREHGCKKGVIAALPEGGLVPSEIARLTAKAARFDMKRVVEEVACQEVSVEGNQDSPRGTCVLLDFGTKTGITTELLAMGYRLVRVPPETPAAAVLAWAPDCVVFANGPGDPEDNLQAIETARSLIGEVPVFGICLGHQIIAKAAGARIIKLKYGHHGANHPVKDLVTGRAFVTSQNHNYAVHGPSLPAGVSITHLNLNDGTVEGLEIRQKAGGKVLAASVQFHPEGAPGPAYRQFWARLEGGYVHA